MIHVCIGTRPETSVYAAVLRRSITSRASAEVQFTDMAGPDWSPPDIIGHGPAYRLRRLMTPDRMKSTGARWAISVFDTSLCLGDIAELVKAMDACQGADVWVADTAALPADPDKASLISIWDCQVKRRWDADRIWRRMATCEVSYDAALRLGWLDRPAAQLPFVHWAKIDSYNSKTQWLHYYRKSWQPAYDPTHPLAGLWEVELKNTIRDGLISREEYKAALALWDQRPSGASLYQGLHPSYASHLRLFDR